MSRTLEICVEVKDDGENYETQNEFSIDLKEVEDYIKDEFKEELREELTEEIYSDTDLHEDCISYDFAEEHANEKVEEALECSDKIFNYLREKIENYQLLLKENNIEDTVIGDNKNHITVFQLIDSEACFSGIARFVNLFGISAEVTEENITKAENDGLPAYYAVNLLSEKLQMEFREYMLQLKEYAWNWKSFGHDMCKLHGVAVDFDAYKSANKIMAQKNAKLFCELWRKENSD